MIPLCQSMAEVRIRVTFPAKAEIENFQKRFGFLSRAPSLFMIERSGKFAGKSRLSFQKNRTEGSGNEKRRRDEMTASAIAKIIYGIVQLSDIGAMLYFDRVIRWAEIYFHCTFEDNDPLMLRFRFID